MKSRKVCIVVASRANYARVKHVMKAVKEHPNLELQLIVGASTLLQRFGKAVDIIKADGFEPDRCIYYVIEGETLTTQAKSTGLGIVELSTAFENLNPDIVVTVADRFETMATAIAASYMNIPLAHIQGGEISGNIDDRVRHAITKLSDIHFPCSDEARERVIKLGENPDYVFNYGCPAMDILDEQNLKISHEELTSKYGGVGIPIDWNKPYILMTQHPVTTSYGDGYKQINKTLEALKLLPNYTKVVLWPNIDAGTDDISKGIRVFREKNMNANFHYFRNFSPEDYAKILANAKCLVGNSSSFIREGSYLGVPAVLIGDRQQGRECGPNVVFADYDKNNILMKIDEQLNNKNIKKCSIFGKGNAGKLIADKLAKIDLNINKRNSF